MKLGSTLRGRAPGFEGGEGSLEVPGPGPCRVSDVLRTAGIDPKDVNLIYRNHVLVGAEASVEDGDRLALFPPNFIHFSQFYADRLED